MAFHQGNMIKKASPTHCCTENWSPWNQSFLLKKKNEKRLIARSRELKGYLRVFRRIKNTDASSQNLLQWEGVENHTTENVEVQEKNKLQKVVWFFFPLEETYPCLALYFLRTWVGLFPLQAKNLSELFLKTFV